MYELVGEDLLEEQSSFQVSCWTIILLLQPQTMVLFFFSQGSPASIIAHTPAAGIERNTLGASHGLQDVIRNSTNAF